MRENKLISLKDQQTSPKKDFVYRNPRPKTRAQSNLKLSTRIPIQRWCDPVLKGPQNNRRSHRLWPQTNLTGDNLKDKVEKLEFSRRKKRFYSFFPILYSNWFFIIIALFVLLQYYQWNLCWYYYLVPSLFILSLLYHFYLYYYFSYHFFLYHHLFRHLKILYHTIIF